MIKKSLLPIFVSLAFASQIFAQQNVLLIIADDIGTDYCGFYEDAQDTANMPHVSSLLGKGVRFTNAWSSPTCSPTRAGILTGRYSFRTGVGTAISGPDYTELDTSETTIGKLLKNAAPVTYATANIGKWHLNQPTPQSWIYPNLMGYDHFSGNYLGELTDYFDWKKVVDGTSPVTVSNYATTETVNDAINWLDGLNGSQPFFLWLAFNAPHTPFHLPPDSLHTVPGLTGTQMDINQNPKNYFRAMTEAMDTEFGRLLQWLDQQGQLDSTNIIFVGDNGNLKRVSQLPDTTRGKGTIYEYGVHVPFIIAGPAVASPGRISEALVSTPDLFATILELAGFDDWPSEIPVDKPVDSRSLVPILKNQSEAERDWNFTEQFSPQPDPDDGKTIRNLAYKLLHFDDGHQEFYHLATDPSEQSDLLLQALDAEAASNYDYLCHELSQLTGTSACDPILLDTKTIDHDDGLALFPNPTSGIFFLKMENADGGPVEVAVFDLLGREAASFFGNGPLLKVESSNLAAGRYFVRVQQGEGVWWSGLVKI
ncbi:MAG: sulfatase-like hydrolase/transferase [Saprospiraceae bacterium]|nr:sulfatase-like hydrolase/transferase [Saprospiraceae bacterium]